MAGFPFDLVMVDIDGTLTRESGWRFYAGQLGRTADYDSENQAYLDGRESEDAHLRGLLRLVEGVPVPRLEGWMEATPKLSGISEAVATLRDASVVPVLLSHNPGYVSAWYARRFGFEDWDGTSRRPVPEVADGVVGAPNGIVADKLGGLRRLLERHSVRPERVAHLGDAPADAAVFPYVGLGVALNASQPAVARSADLSLQVRDLREVLGPLALARPKRPRRMDL